MLVRFIAHAGIYLEEGSFSALIDPWFRGSSVKHPIIESAGIQNSPAIDFQVPPTGEKIEAYAPRVMLLSHFHSHHAPLRDVVELVANSKEILVAYPKLESSVLEERLKKHHNATLRAVIHGETFEHEGVTVRALTHTAPGHVAWFIKGKHGSVLHIADARAHKDPNRRDLDPLWEEFAALGADAVFLSMGGNSLRMDEDKVRYISDARTLTAGEAANLIQKLKPKIAIPIGCYNKSLWSTMREYVPPSHFIEDQFYWALSWTAPEVRAIFMKPGETIGLKTPRFFGSKTDYTI